MLAVAALLGGAPAAGASFGAAVDVSVAGAPAGGGVSVAARTGGGATVAWRRASDGALLARSVSVAGALGPAITVATGTTAQPPVIAEVPGGAALAWIRTSDDHLLVRRLADDGTLGATFDVSGESLNSVNGEPAMAANASGRIAVAWRRPSDSDVRIRLFEIAAGPSAAALDLSDTADIALFGTNVQVAINDAGEAAVTWHRNTDCHILVRRVTAAGAVGAIVDISGEPDSAIGDTSPTVSVRPNGDVVAAWHRDSDHHAVSRRWRADTSLAGIADLSPLGDNPSMANLAIAPLSAGEAVAWQRDSDDHVVAVSGEAGAVSAITDVSAAATAGDTPPAVATTRDPALAVAWVAASGTARVAFKGGVSGPSPLPPSTPPANPAPTTPAPGDTPAAPGPRADHTAPDTRIASGPGRRLRERRASFRFTATEAGSRFECALDDAKFATCDARLTLRRLKPGRHRLRVRAVDTAGNRDRTPASARFAVPRHGRR